ncbi:MAG: hypothetical protein GXP02_07240 [Alphaproteobacteria bacterium]|nr:hypothetical protein [Alphaproteobacteria bacterium]
MSREKLDNFLNQQVMPDKALLTMFEPLAARVGAMEYEDMVLAQALWAANLAKTGRLLDMDALVLGFAPEICSEQEKFSVALAAFDRLVQTEQGCFGCIANMTGPLSLAADILGDAARVSDLKQKTVEMVEAFCKTRPDILLFREGAALGQAKIGMVQRKAYNTLKNMATYYSVPLGIYLENYDPAIIPDLAKLKLPFIFFGADQTGGLPPLEALKDLAGNIKGIGAPLDFDNPAESRAQARTYVRALSGLNILFTSLKELDVNTDLEAILALVSDLRRIRS